MNKCIRKYCKRVQRQLICSHDDKARLINGIQSEISEALSESASYQDVVNLLGTPNKAANQIQNSVSPQSKKTGERRRRFAHAMLSGMFVAIVVFTVFLGAKIYVYYQLDGEITLEERCVHEGRIEIAGAVYGTAVTRDSMFEYPTEFDEP